jgi:acyl carrier protein
MFLQDEFQVRIIQQDLRNVRTMGELVKVFQAKSA